MTGSPQLALTLGATPRNAVLVSGSGSDTLVFEYVVVAADDAPAGITLDASIDLNSGSIKDNSGKDAVVTMTVPDLSGVIVDGTP